MLGKIIVHAPTRNEAILKATEQLREFVLLGVKTNSDYLLKVLNHPSFQAGKYDTGFTDEYTEDLLQELPSQEKLQTILATAYLSDRTTRLLQEATPALYGAIGDWRN